MTRKRLSDLVREEVDREPISEAASQLEVDAPEGAVPQAEATEPPSPTVSQPSRLTKAQLEVQITELTAALATTQERENSRQKQIENLESELQIQKKVVQTLKTQQERASQLETELEEQKTLVKKLYADLQEAQAAQAELAEQKQLVEKLYAELQKVEQQQQETPSASTSEELRLSTPSPYAIQPRPIGRSQPVTTLSNEEIGWFD